MARSTLRSRFSPGRCRFTASRPERPTTSPQRRMFKTAPATQQGLMARRIKKAMGGAASAVDRLNLRGPPLQVGAIYRSHDSDRDSPHEVGIGPGVTCGLTRRAAPPALYLGCLDARRNGLDALGDAADAGGGPFGRLLSRTTP